MSRVLGAVVDWLLHVVAFFDNVKARRDDDELTARSRQLRRSCVWGTVLPLFIAFGGLLIANLLDAFDVALQHAPALSDLRSTASMLFVCAFVAAVAYGAFSYWRLWRFWSDEGGAV